MRRNQKEPEAVSLLVQPSNDYWWQQPKSVYMIQQWATALKSSQKSPETMKESLYHNQKELEPAKSSQKQCHCCSKINLTFGANSRSQIQAEAARSSVTVSVIVIVACNVNNKET